MKAQVAGTRKVTRVVITRSRKGNAELTRKLEARGFVPISIDTLEFLPPEDWSSVDASLRGLGEFDWLLFTSSTGAQFFVQRMRELSLALQWPGKPAVAAVGEKTSAALQGEGVKVDFVPTEYLTTKLAEELPRAQGREALILRADIGNPEVVAALERDGFRVTDLAIYRNSSASGTQEAAVSAVRSADAIVFASPSAVEAFMRRLGSAEPSSKMTRELLAVCIGPVTAAAAKGRGFERILSPKTHTVEGLVRCMEEAAAEGK